MARLGIFLLMTLKLKKAILKCLAQIQHLLVLSENVDESQCVHPKAEIFKISLYYCYLCDDLLSGSNGFIGT